MDDNENLLVSLLDIPIELTISSIPKVALNFFLSEMKRFGFYIVLNDESFNEKDKSIKIKLVNVPTILIKKIKNKNKNDVLLMLNSLIETHLKVSY